MKNKNKKTIPLMFALTFTSASMIITNIEYRNVYAATSGVAGSGSGVSSGTLGVAGSGSGVAGGTSGIVVPNKKTVNIVATDYKFSVNGKEYKLKGNGTNEFETLQLMFDSLNLKYNGSNIVIHFPAGNYCSNKSVTIYSNMTITGMKDLTVFKNTSKSPFFVNGKTSSHPDSKKFQPEYTGGAGSNITIQNVSFNQSRVIAIGHGNNIIINNIYVTDCPKGNAIEIAASKDVVIKNSLFEGMDSEAQKNGADFIRISANNKKSFPYFGKYDDSKYERVNKNITIDGCTFKKSKKNGLTSAIGADETTNSKTSHDNILIKNCIIESGKTVIKFPSVTNFALINNTIKNASVGFEHTSKANNNDIKSITITGNKFDKVEESVRIDKRSTKSKINLITIENNTFKGKSLNSSIGVRVMGTYNMNTLNIENNKYSSVNNRINKEGKVFKEPSFTKGIVSTGGVNLNVRKEASLISAKLGTLKHNDYVEVKLIRGDWAEIIYNNQTAYVSSAYIKDRNSVKIGTITDNGVRLRTGAGTNYNIITTLNKNAKLTILSTNSKWYKVKYNNTTGYVYSDYVKVK